MADEKKFEQGLPIAVDTGATSAKSDEPALLFRPPGAPIYHGFPMLVDVSVDGFTFGKISDFEAQESNWGDAFIVAPDNGRAGIVWQLGDEPAVSQIQPLEPDRWGVWQVTFMHPMISRENAKRNLESVLPLLKPHWEQWRRQRQQRPPI